MRLLAINVASLSCVVRVVAGSWLPPIAGGAEVELPPHAVEDRGARAAAVHLRGDRERWNDNIVGVRIWLKSVGLQAWGTYGSVRCLCCCDIVGAGSCLFEGREVLMKKD